MPKIKAPKPQPYTPFEPRPYQKEVFENLHESGFVLDSFRLRQLTRKPTHIGIDLATKKGDMSAVAYMQGNKIQTIIIDEYANWDPPKWYRNPIKWWRLREITKLVKEIERKHKV